MFMKVLLKLQTRSRLKTVSRTSLQGRGAPGVKSQMHVPHSRGWCVAC